MPGINSVELLGGVTRAEIRAVGSRGAMVQSFTVAVKSAEYNRETRQDEVVQTFIPCERFLPDDYTFQDVVYKGDGVYCRGEITQQKGTDGREHTRVRVHQVLVSKRGNEFKAQAQTGSAPAAATGPATDDAWGV